MNKGHFEVQYLDSDTWEPIGEETLHTRISDPSCISEMKEAPGREYHLTNFAWYRWVEE